MSQPAVPSLTFFTGNVSCFHILSDDQRFFKKQSWPIHAHPVFLVYIYLLGPTHWGARRLAQYDKLKDMIRISFWSEAIVITLFFNATTALNTFSWIVCLFVGPVFSRGKQLPGCISVQVIEKICQQYHVDFFQATSRPSSTGPPTGNKGLT